MINKQGQCPECNTNWKQRDGSRLIGIEVWGIYDGVLYWQCPDCKTTWGRFSGKKRDFTKKKNIKAEQKVVYGLFKGVSI